MKNSFLICFHLIGRDRWSLGYQDNLVSVTNGSVFLPGTSCHLPWEQTWDTVLGLAVNGEIFFCLQSLRIAFERHCAVVNTGRILKLFSFFVARFFESGKCFVLFVILQHQHSPEVGRRQGRTQPRRPPREHSPAYGLALDFRLPEQRENKFLVCSTAWFMVNCRGRARKWVQQSRLTWQLYFTEFQGLRASLSMCSAFLRVFHVLVKERWSCCICIQTTEQKRSYKGTHGQHQCFLKENILMLSECHIWNTWNLFPYINKKIISPEKGKNTFWKLFYKLLYIILGRA